MKNWFAICLVAASSVLFVETRQADAAAANNTYITYVSSNVSGDFTAVLTFTANAFVLIADDGDLGGGTFTEIGPFVTGIGVNGDYVGGFTGITIGNNFIIGAGQGTAGDSFWFIGF